MENKRHYEVIFVRRKLRERGPGVDEVSETVPLMLDDYRGPPEQEAAWFYAQLEKHVKANETKGPIYLAALLGKSREPEPESHVPNRIGRAERYKKRYHDTVLARYLATTAQESTSSES
jgi:hypothetical protein